MFNSTALNRQNGAVRLTPFYSDHDWMVMRFNPTMTVPLFLKNIRHINSFAGRLQQTVNL